ncbi:MAG: phenylalanine--tRNA ligase subunit alpha [Candidatus Nanoarchaeia archaeon]
MEVKRLAESLQDAEIVVLKSLRRGAVLSTEELTAKTRLSQETINRAALWLQNKQLLSVREHPHFLIRLSKLGEKYATTELPERKFLQTIMTKAMYPDDIAKCAGLNKQEILFSLGYWKTKNAISIEAGKIAITSVGKDYLQKSTLEETFLKKLRQKGEIPYEELPLEDQAAFEALLKRGLVNKIEKKIREFLITQLGVKVADAVKSETRIGQLTPQLIKTGAWKSSAFRRFDVTAPVPKLWPGKKQVYRAFLDAVKEELVALGFEEITGPLVEMSFWNLDALYMPQDHPARGIHDIYYVKEPKYGKLSKINLLHAIRAVHENGGKTGSKGWQYTFNEQESARLMLRSHGTALSARMLANPNVKIPGAYFAIARVYRPDICDAAHLTEFNQCEGIVLGENLNFRNLLGLLAEFMKKLTGSEKFRFVPGYFPFTEPSVEGAFWHAELRKWIEIGGAGILRPEVTLPLGIKVPVLAWGLGIDRLFMIKENISDIRQLFSSDIQWLREAKL